MMTLNPLFLLLTVLWFCSEGQLLIKCRTTSTSQDRGTLPLLLIAFSAAFIIAIAASYYLPGRIAEPPRELLIVIGYILMLLGIVFRRWAIHVLAEFFTVNVTIKKNHKLIQHGPYRLLRHPSYTGFLLSMLGFGLALGNWLSIIVLGVIITPLLIYRIRVEEAALRSAFPDQYQTYAQHTKRLIPFIW